MRRNERTIFVRLKELREIRGLTQADLARKVGVRQATISNLETGKSGRIAFALLERLSKTLHVRLSELFR